MSAVFALFYLGTMIPYREPERGQHVTSQDQDEIEELRRTHHKLQRRRGFAGVEYRRLTPATEQAVRVQKEQQHDAARETRASIGVKQGYSLIDEVSRESPVRSRRATKPQRNALVLAAGA